MDDFLYQGKYHEWRDLKNSKETNRFQLFHFIMDWKKSDSTQIEQFNRWLAANRPPEIKPIEKRGGASGKKSIKAELKALGAYRLLKKMDWKQALLHSQKFTIFKDKKGIGYPLYQHQSEWLTAKKRAEGIISKLCL
jgi:hypothetical protein